MDGKETIQCQINCFSINHFYETLGNKIIEFPLLLMFHYILFNKLTFNNLTDLTHLITFFMLILSHTVRKIGMHGLLYILTFALWYLVKKIYRKRSSFSVQNWHVTFDNLTLFRMTGVGGKGMQKCLLTLLPYWRKMSRPKLVSVPNYWTSTKTAFQKSGFSGQIYIKLRLCQLFL